MKDLSEIIQNILPIVLIAIVTSSLTTVSVQGFKNFLNIEIKGNYSRVLTLVIAVFWSWTLIVYFGKGAYQDFVMALIMTLLGATGIYEVLLKKEGSK